MSNETLEKSNRSNLKSGDDDSDGASEFGSGKWRCSECKRSGEYRYSRK